MKIAYLVLVHRNPLLLERVIQTLSSQNSAFFVHVDRKSNLREFSGIKSNSTFFSDRRIPVYWGEFSQVEATFLLMQQALRSSVRFDYFILLHGSDYPLRSNEYIQSFLEENRGYEFISAVKMPAPGYPLSKINKLRYPSNKPLLRFASRALGKLGLAERNYMKHIGKLDAYAGDACWALSRNACNYLLEYLRNNPQVEAYFRNTFTPDEVLFHTVLGNSPFVAQFKRSILYTDWPLNLHNHPAVLNEEHLRLFEAHDKVEIEDEWGRGEVLFARKLSDDQLDLVDGIEKMIVRKGNGRGVSLPNANT
jgi:hypothetical protein